MSFIRLFIEASFFVQIIGMLLLLASIWSWALFFYKLYVFWKAKQLDSSFLVSYRSRNLPASELYETYKSKDQIGPLTSMFVSGMSELERYKKWEHDHKDKGNFDEMLEQQMNSLMEANFNRVISNLRTMLPSWATIAGAAPFVGLLGTVWGIMASFSALGHDISQVTLQSLAPGIAEALFATALGLFAAIPALVFYNIFLMRIQHWEFEGDLFMKDFNRLMFYYKWQQQDSDKDNSIQNDEKDQEIVKNEEGKNDDASKKN